MSLLQKKIMYVEDENRSGKLASPYKCWYEVFPWDFFIMCKCNQRRRFKVSRTVMCMGVYMYYVCSYKCVNMHIVVV